MTRVILLPILFGILCADVSAREDLSWVPALRPDTPAIISYGSDVAVPEGFTQPVPTTRQIIHWMLEHLDAPVSKQTTISLSGQTARGTVRDFLCIPLELHTGIKGKNWIDAKCEPVTSPANKRFWHCGLIFWREYETTRMGFGVSFLVTDSLREVVPNSFRTSSYE
jgi:hypothetical protein